jgi:hypothetical protein
MTTLQTIDSWVPVAVANVAARLHAQFIEQNSEEGLTILSRLTSDRRMRAVWQRLYSKKRDEKYRSTDVFVYPAITLKSRAANLRRQAHDLREKGGESNEIEADCLDSEANAAMNAQAKAEEALPGFANYSASVAQDSAVARFFEYACRAAIDITPTYLSDIEARLAKTGAISLALREQKAELFELELWDEADKLGEIIEQCDDLVELQSESIQSGDPIIISRKRGDPKLRSYVVQLYELGFALFGTPLYGTLATMANVVFDCKTVTRQMVQDWLP